MGESSPSRRKPTVVVAGQMPPPLGGQNINIKRVFDLLREEPDLEVKHLRFQFTREWTGARQAALFKVVELVRVFWRALRLRFGGRIDLLLYPAGGPHTIPIIRDLLLLPFLALLSKKVVVQFRAAGLAERLEESGSVLRWLCRFAYGRCAAAVVQAPYGKRDPEALGLSEIIVLPNAFEDRARTVVDRPEPNKPVLLSVGHLCSDKGVPQLIEVCGGLAADPDQPGFSLVLVGEPLAPYSEDQLRTEIKRSGAADRMTWKGVLSGKKLEDAYREADLVVFGSVAPYESFGMVLIEAMQWSLPLVVTDWRGNLSVCTEGFGGVVARSPEKDHTASLDAAVRKP